MSHSEVETTGQICGFESLRPLGSPKPPERVRLLKVSSERRPVDPGRLEWLRGGRKEVHGGDHGSVVRLERTESGECCYRGQGQ